MTRPSEFTFSEKKKLKVIVSKIQFVPYNFSGDGRTVDLRKVMRVINNYGA